MTDPRTRFPDIGITQEEARQIMEYEASAGIQADYKLMCGFVLIMRTPPKYRDALLEYLRQNAVPGA